VFGGVLDELLRFKDQECAFDAVNMCQGRHFCTPFLHPEPEKR
jgi:hypothetical protein